MNIPKLTDEQISKAKELWNAMNKAMEENGIRLCYNYGVGEMVVVPMELEPCADDDEMILEEDHEKLMERGSLGECKNAVPWFCIGSEYSFSVKKG